ncbi:MAG: glycoside hydrolase family 16 protein [Burkholderiaceae bacterium]|nr:glycoside hydrolase family 16 protein [Burkholderiaceae bacterium]
MKKPPESTACALAAALLVSACGGGDPATDTTPPTVAITAAAGPAGTVVFTFSFSEPVGNTFAAEDVTVTGGNTAAAVTQVDATHYTLSVLQVSGTVSVTLGAGKFSDAANNVNVASASKSYSDPASNVPAGYKLVWSDEFSNAGLPDSSRWAYDTYRNPVGWFNNELQYYAAARPQNSSIADGVLSITARRERLGSAPDYGNQDFSSARLITQGKFSFTYGFVEVRARLPCSLGTWPAIWTLGIPADNWPTNGEIDIMEQRGFSAADKATVLGTLHMPAHFAGGGLSESRSLPDACTAFHKYQLLWTANQIQIGVDGVVYNTYAKPAGATASTWPFDVPQFILLNLAIGGDLGGPVPAGFTSDSLQVDYVRVYRP